MKGILLSLICFGLVGPVLAEPSSKVAWTLDTLNLVKKGNAENGKNLAGTCAGCHNDTINANPQLEGQLPTYIYKQLVDYKNNSRKDPIMNDQAKNLSEQDMADIAAFYGKQAAKSLCQIANFQDMGHSAPRPRRRRVAWRSNPVRPAG